MARTIMTMAVCIIFLSYIKYRYANIILYIIKVLHSLICQELRELKDLKDLKTNDSP